MSTLDREYLKSRVPTQRAASSHSSQHEDLTERDSWLTGMVTNGQKASRHHPASEERNGFGQSHSKAATIQKEKLINRQLNWNAFHHTKSSKLPGAMDKFQHEKMEVVAAGSRRAIVHCNPDTTGSTLKKYVKPFAHLTSKEQQLANKEAGYGLQKKSKVGIRPPSIPPPPSTSESGFTTQDLRNRKKNTSWSVPASVKKQYKDVGQHHACSAAQTSRSDGTGTIAKSSGENTEGRNSGCTPAGDMQECMAAARDAGLTNDQMHKILDSLVGHETVDKSVILSAISEFQKKDVLQVNETKVQDSTTTESQTNRSKSSQQFSKKSPFKIRTSKMHPPNSGPSKKSISLSTIVRVSESFEFSYPKDWKLLAEMGRPGRVKVGVKELWAMTAMDESTQKMRESRDAKDEGDEKKSPDKQRTNLLRPALLPPPTRRTSFDRNLKSSADKAIPVTSVTQSGKTAVSSAVEQLEEIEQQSRVPKPNTETNGAPKAQVFKAKLRKSMRKDMKVSAPAPAIARTQESTVKNNLPLKLDKQKSAPNNARKAELFKQRLRRSANKNPKVLAAAAKGVTSAPSSNWR